MYLYTLPALALLGAVTATNSTVNLALLAFDQQPIEASIIGQDSTATTYSLSCPSPTNYDTCGVPPSFTVTQGPSTLHYAMSADASQYSSMGDVGSDAYSNSVDYACQITSSSSAVCTVTGVGSYNGSSISTVDSTTITAATDLGYVSVTVTAGATTTGSGTNASISSSSTSKSSGSSSKASSGAVVTSNPAMPAITAQAQWVLGGAAAVLAYGAM